MASNAYCVFEYLYRDASNYKVWGMLLLSGTPTPQDEAVLRQCLEAIEYFVAEQVGIPTLYGPLWELSGGPTDDDHAFHEFFSLRAATEEEVSGLQLFGSLHELLQSFQAVTRWDCTLSPNCDFWP